MIEHYYINYPNDIEVLKISWKEYSQWFLLIDLIAINK